tara:strand:- start:50 stop:424 length:375 start_codon:yes stop_codon:yes gene_type:complete
MKINEVILDEGSAGIQKWVSSLRPELAGGAYFNTYDDWLRASKAKPGSWKHKAAMNSPQHPDRGFKWNTKENRRKMKFAVAAGLKGAEEFTQKLKNKDGTIKEPFVPNVKDKVDIYKNVRYPTN